jgi:hypothetical protein
MWQSIIRPISQRLATGIGASLGALGMAHPDVAIVEAAIPVICGFAFDLVLRKLY